MSTANGSVGIVIGPETLLNQPLAMANPVAVVPPVALVQPIASVVQPVAPVTPVVQPADPVAPIMVQPVQPVGVQPVGVQPVGAQVTQTAQAVLTPIGPQPAPVEEKMNFFDKVGVWVSAHRKEIGVVGATLVAAKGVEMLLNNSNQTPQTRTPQYSPPPMNEQPAPPPPRRR